MISNHLPFVMSTVLTVFISCICISVFVTIQVSSVFILVNFMIWYVRFHVSMFQMFCFILKVSSFCLPLRLLLLLSWLLSSFSPVKFLLHCWLPVSTLTCCSYKPQSFIILCELFTCLSVQTGPKPAFCEGQPQKSSFPSFSFFLWSTLRSDKQTLKHEIFKNIIFRGQGHHR